MQAGLVILCLVVPGCLTASDDWDKCDYRAGAAVNLLPANGIAGDDGDAVPSDVPIRTTESLFVEVLSGACPTPGRYIWTISDLRAVTGNATDFGGFGSQTIVTKNASVALEFPHVGSFWVHLRFERQDGSVHPYIVEAIQVHTYGVLESSLPLDGSTYTDTFSSICCPTVWQIEFGSAGQGLERDWISSFHVEGTGEEIWRGRPLDWTGTEFRDTLGTYWNETIVFSVEPAEAVPPPEALSRQHSVSMRIGQYTNWIAEV